jgi:hypothetical protein
MRLSKNAAVFCTWVPKYIYLPEFDAGPRRARAARDRESSVAMRRPAAGGGAALVGPGVRLAVLACVLCPDLSAGLDNGVARTVRGSVTLSLSPGQLLGTRTTLSPAFLPRALSARCNDGVSDRVCVARSRRWVGTRGGTSRVVSAQSCWRRWRTLWSPSGCEMRAVSAVPLCLLL